MKDALSLKPAGMVGELFETHYAGLDLGRRGYLIAINDTFDPLIEEGVLSSLSRRWKVIACQVEEHSMYCSTQCWENGNRGWQVEHNAQISLMHLSVTGEIPEQFEVIRGKALEWQNAERNGEVDYIFEVPCLLGWRLTGFKHDRYSPLWQNRPIEELTAATPMQASPQSHRAAWWKFW